MSSRATTEQSNVDVTKQPGTKVTMLVAYGVAIVLTSLSAIAFGMVGAWVAGAVTATAATLITFAVAQTQQGESGHV